MKAQERHWDTPEKRKAFKEKFQQEYRRTGSIKKAAEALGFKYQNVVRMMRKHKEEFSDVYDWGGFGDREKLNKMLKRVDDIEAKRAKETFLELYRKSFLPVKARQALGISKKKIAEWIEQDPEFREKYEEVPEIVEAQLWNKMFEVAMQDNRDSTIARMFLLKSINPEKYRDRYFPTKQAEAQTIVYISNLHMEKKEIQGQDLKEIIDGEFSRAEEQEAGNQKLSAAPEAS